MSTATRRAREKDQRRRAILAAAIRCFGRKGYDRATLDDVASEAEIAKGTVYLYFKSKADLFASLLLERGFDVFSQSLKAELDRCASSTQAIWTFGRLFYELCLEGRKELFDFFIQLDRGDIARDLSPDLRRDARSRLEGVLGQIGRWIDRGRRSGELSGPAGWRVALVFWAFCVGVAHAARSGLPARQILDDGLDILMQGIGHGSRKRRTGRS